MVTRRVFDTMGARYWDEPSGTELVFIILNYTLSIPVLLAVGAFRYVYVTFGMGVFNFEYLHSLYHFYGLLGNSTTIEGWEKDKVATLVRRGKMREVGSPLILRHDILLLSYR
jgi:palmitoyltransferase ZDHHC6